jgi:multidrug efflux pump subunit AcrA (membrane-fusion protein)
MPLFEVMRNDKVRLIAKVPMIRAERIKLGQPVIFHSIGGLPGLTVEGRVSRSATVLDPNSRMLEIQVDLTNPVKRAGWIKQDRKWVKQKAVVSRTVNLKPGMVGTATILESWEDLPVLPTTAVVVNEGGNSYVLVVENGGGKRYCRRRIVDVAFNDASEVGISAGISPGDVVIIKNIDNFSDGQQVATVGGI